MSQQRDTTASGLTFRLDAEDVLIYQLLRGCRDDLGGHEGSSSILFIAVRVDGRVEVLDGVSDAIESRFGLERRLRAGLLLETRLAMLWHWRLVETHAAALAAVVGGAGTETPQSRVTRCALLDLSLDQEIIIYNVNSAAVQARASCQLRVPPQGVRVERIGVEHIKTAPIVVVVSHCEIALRQERMRLAAHERIAAVDTRQVGVCAVVKVVERLIGCIVAVERLLTIRWLVIGTRADSGTNRALTLTMIVLLADSRRRGSQCNVNRRKAELFVAAELRGRHEATRFRAAMANVQHIHGLRHLHLDADCLVQIRRVVRHQAFGVNALFEVLDKSDVITIRIGA